MKPHDQKVLVATIIGAWNGLDEEWYARYNKLSSPRHEVIHAWDLEGPIADDTVEVVSRHHDPETAQGIAKQLTLEARAKAVIMALGLGTVS